MMKADSFSPARRKKMKWIEIVKPCVVDGENVPAGKKVKTNQVDADMLIFNYLAKASSQADEPRRGRPPKE